MISMNQMCVRFLLPVCWYSAVSGEEDNITEFPGPQVGLHASEGVFSMTVCLEMFI